MRTINVDFRWVDSMEKCKDEIIKQIEEIELNPDKIIETPVCFILESLILKDSDDSLSKRNVNAQLQASDIDTLYRQFSIGLLAVIIHGLSNSYADVSDIYKIHLN
jgi:hypothetical protein